MNRDSKILLGVGVIAVSGFFLIKYLTTPKSKWHVGTILTDPYGDTMIVSQVDTSNQFYYMNYTGGPSSGTGAWVEWSSADDYYVSG